MSRARFESKLTQASTAYRMTFYRHHFVGSIELAIQLLRGKTESGPGKIAL